MSGVRRAWRVAVIGGGITGLAAAHRLAELGRERDLPLEVALFEAAPRLGGTIRSEHRDGFLVEEGPDSFITEKPWGLDLCRRVGLTDELIPTDERFRRAFVVCRGRLHAIPEGFLLLAPSRLWPLVASPILSWKGKLRVALDLVLPKGRAQDDESLASFVRRRLGREVLERLAQPLVGGVYTADPERLSLAATMPRFLQLERDHRSLIRALRRQQDRAADQELASGARYSLFVTPRTGMESLVTAVARRLPAACVRLSTPAVKVQYEDALGTWAISLQSGAREEADAVILTVPTYQAARLLDDDRELSERLNSISYASTAVVNLAYRRDSVGHPLDGFGLVVPAVEGRRIIACSFSSVKFSGRAPDGFVLLRSFVGGALHPHLFELDDDALVSTVHRELTELLTIRGEPVMASIRRHERAMPQYHVGHLAKVAEIERLAARRSGLFLAGNGFGGTGIPDCVHGGELAAERVVAQWVTSPGQRLPAHG